METYRAHNISAGAFCGAAQMDALVESSLLDSSRGTTDADSSGSATSAQSNETDTVAGCSP